MRRLYTSLLALGLLGGSQGCYHTAGICDCDIPGYDAHIAGPYGPPPGTPVIQPEPIKAMPKGDIKDDSNNKGDSKDEALKDDGKGL